MMTGPAIGLSYTHYRAPQHPLCNHLQAVSAACLASRKFNSRIHDVLINSSRLPRMTLHREMRREQNNPNLMGISHQILLSEMSLPGIEVPIEKLLPNTSGKSGEKPFK